MWNKDGVYHAASPVVTRDGIKEIYRCAWDTGYSDLNEKKKAWTAKNYCKKQLSGTMNIIDWFGKKALDMKGNIDKTRLNELFAMQAVMADKGNKYPEELWPEKKFPTKEITFEEARRLELA